MAHQQGRGRRTTRNAEPPQIQQIPCFPFRVASVTCEANRKLGDATVLLLPTEGGIHISTTKKVSQYAGYIDLAREVGGPNPTGDKFKVDVPVVYGRGSDLLGELKGPPLMEFVFNTEPDANSFVAKIKLMK